MTRADDTVQASEAQTVYMMAQTRLAGAEAGLVGVEPPTLPATCLRECLEPTGKPCPQLGALIDGDVAQGTSHIATCARGHMLAVCPEPEGGRTLVLLQPSNRGRQEHCALMRILLRTPLIVRYIHPRLYHAAD